MAMKMYSPLLWFPELWFRDMPRTFLLCVGEGHTHQSIFSPTNKAFLAEILNIKCISTYSVPCVFYTFHPHQKKCCQAIYAESANTRTKKKMKERYLFWNGWMYSSPRFKHYEYFFPKAEVILAYRRPNCCIATYYICNYTFTYTFRNITTQ